MESFAQRWKWNSHNFIVLDKGVERTEVASNEDPFQAYYYSSNLTRPPGGVILGFSKKVQLFFVTIAEILRYGSPEPPSIFIRNSVLREWKSTSERVSTNDLIAVQLLKGWASTATRRTISVFTVQKTPVRNCTRAANVLAQCHFRSTLPPVP